MRQYPAYTHWDVMRMPWITFLALSEEAAEFARRQRDARYFKTPALQDEWEENKEEWLRLQPPPDSR